MSVLGNFDDQVERLRAMLGEHDVWEEPESLKADSLILVPQPEILRDADIFGNPEYNEKFLPTDHMIGGRLEQLLGPSETPSESIALLEYNLRVGEEAPAGEAFCPLLALIKYPFKYVAAAYHDNGVRTFFDKGQIYERIWDFFYIYPPESVSHKAIILLPSRQVEQFLFTINSSLKAQLTMPKDPRFLVDFPEDGTPRPRYLGRSDEREMAEILKQAAPSRSYRPDGESRFSINSTDKSLVDFKRKMELLVENDKKKKAAVKERKRAERIEKQQSWNHTIKRVQRYLGIRDVQRGHYETVNPIGESFIGPALKWSAFGEAAKAAAAKIVADVTLDIEKPLPFKTDYDVIFICIDVETWERNHNLITEIGIATLDTADITSLAPGEGGKNWVPAIRARHFRIKEYSHLENSDFVGGCSECFQFGSSEWISIKDAPREISKCFEHPYSRNSIEPALITGSSLPNKFNTKRNIILVGHDVTADINYLRQLNCDPCKVSGLQELIDTSLMYRALRREPQARNLGSILADLDIAGWYLHNAGNDAMYTLQAMVSIALRAKLEKQDKTSREQEKIARIEGSVKDALNHAWDAQQGWSSGGEGSDGGDPEALIPPVSLDSKQNHSGRVTKTREAKRGLEVGLGGTW